MQIMDSTGEWIADKLEVRILKLKCYLTREINIEFGYLVFK